MRGAVPRKGRVPSSTRSKSPGQKKLSKLSLHDRRPSIWKKFSARVSPKEEQVTKSRGKAPMQRMAEDGVNMDDEVEDMETEMSPEREYS